VAPRTPSATFEADGWSGRSYLVGWLIGIVEVVAFESGGDGVDLVQHVAVSDSAASGFCPRRTRPIGFDSGPHLECLHGIKIPAPPTDI
jgi:hypothetical protein